MAEFIRDRRTLWTPFCRVRPWIALLVLAVPGFLFSCQELNLASGQEPAPVSEEDVKRCSVLRVALANAEAWSSGDVLVEVNDSFDNVALDDPKGPLGAAYTKRERFRFVFDFGNKLFLQAAMSDGDGIFLHAGRDPVGIVNGSVTCQITNFPAGFHFDLNPHSTGYMPLKPERLKEYGLETELQRLRMKELRGCWIGIQNGIVFSPSLFAAKSKTWEMLAEGRNLERKLFDSASPNEFGFENTNIQGDFFRTRVKIDPESKMPTHFLQTVKSPNQAETFTMCDLSIDWKEKDFVYYPVRFRISGAHRVVKDGDETYGTLTQDVRFHWFSINEPVDDSLFERGRIKNKQDVAALLDPVALKATTLLKDEAKTAPNASGPEKQSPIHE